MAFYFYAPVAVSVRVRVHLPMITVIIYYAWMRRGGCLGRSGQRTVTLYNGLLADRFRYQLGRAAPPFINAFINSHSRESTSASHYELIARFDIRFSFFNEIALIKNNALIAYKRHQRVWLHPNKYFQVTYLHY